MNDEKLISKMLAKIGRKTWADSSVGRALRSHRRGWGSNPPISICAPVAQMDRAAVS